MATNRRLSRDFELAEFPGWQTATELQVQRLELLVREIVQPARRAYGPIKPTSWIRASGAHATGGALDFVPVLAHQENPENGVRIVHGWIATYRPSSFGELLYELPSPGEARPHIHVTLPGIGGEGEVLTQTGWDGSRPRWELGYLVPSVLPALVAAAALLWFVFAAAGGAASGSG